MSIEYFVESIRRKPVSTKWTFDKMTLRQKAISTKWLGRRSVVRRSVVYPTKAGRSSYYPRGNALVLRIIAEDLV